ncbi:hypothetical protein BpHYR1_026465 [Brachionus plicatilis]|uniref:Uncharacterized protein n=1 Tax=Brachionus plicatilis TaxID=10195 RepID=A0A3M7QWU3_BRAPC|nr:hypothetical protein BpHYR1_026465 [Brachionus plicatilis]
MTKLYEHKAFKNNWYFRKGMKCKGKILVFLFIANYFICLTEYITQISSLLKPLLSLYVSFVLNELKSVTNH